MAGDGAEVSLFPDVPAIQPVGDDLDRCYTPIPLADACVEIVARVVPSPQCVVEPSVGGGSFVRAIRRRWTQAHIAGHDIDPGAVGLGLVDRPVVGDWLTGSQPPADVVIGNPPFSDDAAIDHVRRALDVGEVVGLILPWSFLGGVERWNWLHTAERRPLAVYPITPRPWGDRVRETALYVWAGRTGAPARIGEPIRWRP